MFHKYDHTRLSNAHDALMRGKMLDAFDVNKVSVLILRLGISIHSGSSKREKRTVD